MLEVEHRQRAPIEVILYDDKHRWVKSSSAAALLPFSFNRETLAADYPRAARWLPDDAVQGDAGVPLPRADG